MSDHPTLERWLWPPEARRLAQDAVANLQVRRELLELEVRHDVRSIRRLVIVGGIGLILIVIGLPILLLATAHQLAEVTSWNLITWLLILAAAVIVPGGIVLVGAISRFRREFSGLHHSLAELHEDMLWLREWTDAE